MSRLPAEVHELTPGQLAKRSKVAISALHFYERKGLISSYRTEGNQRRYSRDTLRRVAFIRASQSVGISLDDISDALGELPESRTPNKSDWARLSARWRSDLDERIARLEKLRNGLTGCISCGCLSLHACGLVNADDMFSATHDEPNRLESTNS